MEALLAKFGLALVLGVAVVIALGVWWYVHNKRKHPGKVEDIVQRTEDEVRKHL